MTRTFNSRIMSFAAVLCSLVLFAVSANAQNRDSTGTILPDLSPQEVEIRGQLEISFPSLRRQPLIGFNPPPRVPEIPENYMPFLEPYKLSGTDFPTNQAGNFDPPDVLPINEIYPTVGELEASAGRYLARVIRARLSAPLTFQSTIYGKVDYEGSEGYSPEDAIDDLRNPYDGIRSTIGFQSSGPRVTTGLELNGLVNSYTLFGTNFRQNGTLSTEIVLPDRIGLNGNAEFWLNSYSESIDTEFRLGFGSSRYRTDVFASGLVALPRLNQQERRLNASFGIDVPFSIGSFILSSSLSTSGINLSTPTVSIDDFGLFEFKNYAVEARSGFKLRLSPRIALTVAGNYIGTSFIELGQEQSRSFLTAHADLSFYPVSGLTFYVRNEPGIDTNTLWDVFTQNPYVIDQPPLQSTLRPIDAKAGFTFYKGIMQLSANVGFIQSPNFLFFENIIEQPITGYEYRRGVFQNFYDDVEIVHANGAASLMLNNGLHFKFSIAVREAELSDTNQEVPYFSPFVSENMVSYAFADNSMLIQMIGSFHSSRYRFRTETERIDSYVDLDFLYTYMLNTGLGFVVRVDNILNAPLEYWEDYKESPFTLSAGFRVLW